MIHTGVTMTALEAASSPTAATTPTSATTDASPWTPKAIAEAILCACLPLGFVGAEKLANTCLIFEYVANGVLSAFSSTAHELQVRGWLGPGSMARARRAPGDDRRATCPRGVRHVSIARPRLPLPPSHFVTFERRWGARGRVPG